MPALSPLLRLGLVRLGLLWPLFLSPLLLGSCHRAATETPVAAVSLEGRRIIDTRDPRKFAAGHAPGALNIQSGYDQLRHRIAGYVPDRSQPLAVRAESAQEARAAARVLEGEGYEDVVALEAPPPEPERLTLWTAEDLRAALDGPAPPVVLDVRTRAEQDAGVIPGAVLLDQDGALEGTADLDPARPYAVICAVGWRSSQLASSLRERGFVDVVNVIDGMRGWEEQEEER